MRLTDAHDGTMTTSTPIGQGLGITAGLDARLAGGLAARGAQLGYHSLWSNDEPTAPGLETLAHFAAAAPRLDLWSGRPPPRPISTCPDRRGYRPPRARSGKALDWDRVRAAAPATRRGAAGRRTASRASAAGNAHRCRRDAASTLSPRWRDRRRRAAQLGAARPGGASAPVGSGRSRRMKGEHRPSPRRMFASPSVPVAAPAARRRKPLP